MNDLAVRQDSSLTAVDMRAHVNLIQEVMQAVMKESTHYGKIPGTPKPSLWKPGAEILCATFRIAPSYNTDDLSTDDFIRYRVTCLGTHQSTGVVLGEGMGECSSNEEKYKWKKAGLKEYNATPENRKRVKFYNNNEVQQVRTEPADLANTILKMACKRAQVAMALNVTAASDIFTQDIEDLPEELRGVASGDPGKTETRGTVQPYPSEQFDKNFAAWEQLIETGQKTADAVIAQVESKGTLTDGQKKKVRDIKVMEGV